MANEGNIIIKKIKKGGHGHHGGAWKVAYADFVTAMMAFFLLLWLLSSTSESQKEGIAEYFTPTTGIRGEMGIGVDGGISASPDGKSKEELAPPGIIFGAPPTGEIPKDPTDSKKTDRGEEAQEQKNLDKIEKDLKEAFEKDPKMKELKEHVIIEQTPEGLRIQIVDQDKKPMFLSGSSVLQDKARIILTKVAEVIKQAPNKISVTGHTDSVPYKRADGYGNWELSSDRANSSRRFLIDVNVPEERYAKVEGKADKELLIKDNPQAPQNRRISITLLKKSISPYDMPAPDELLNAPRPDDRENFNVKPRTLAE